MAARNLSVADVILQKMESPVFLYNDNTPISFTDDLPEAVDVTIIGGGVIGICIAWFLRERGYSVLVCDKGRVAGEQSSRNWGWVRAMGRDPDEVPIAMEAIGLWEQLSEQLGPGIGFKRGGIAAFARNEKELAELEEWLPVAKQYGLNTAMLDSEAANDMISAPQGRWAGVMHTPSDGRAEPFTAVKTLATALQARGGLIREACAVRTIEQQAGNICGVNTEHGYVKCSSAVVAGGVWSAMFLRNLGITIPQLAVRGTVARTAEAPEILSGAAGLGDVYLRRRQDGGYTIACEMVEHFIGASSFRHLTKYIPAMFTGSDIRARPGKDPTQPWFFSGKWSGEDETAFERHRVLNPNPSAKALKTMRKNLDKRVPELNGVAFTESWGGMIDAMPDIVPVMDKVESTPGLFIATGFSAHGFGIGPGAGKVMADMIAGDQPRYDLSRFRFGRFSDGSKMRPGPAL
jgi:glycine/D-amino acid oxidase-like deaminating enzyme